MTSTHESFPWLVFTSDELTVSCLFKDRKEVRIPCLSCAVLPGLGQWSSPEDSCLLHLLEPESPTDGCVYI